MRELAGFRLQALAGTGYALPVRQQGGDRLQGVAEGMAGYRHHQVLGGAHGLLQIGLRFQAHRQFAVRQIALVHALRRQLRDVFGVTPPDLGGLLAPSQLYGQGRAERSGTQYAEFCHRGSPTSAGW